MTSAQHRPGDDPRMDEDAGLGPAPAAAPRRDGRAPRGPLLLMVGASVALQLTCATLLKSAAVFAGTRLLTIAAVLAVVGALSFGRFLIWNRIHRAYPVSIAYPLSAVFFPGVVLIAWLSGESVGWAQVAGALLVMAGVVRILSDPNVDEELQ